MSATHAASPAGSDVDVRGFVYALEPVRQKLQWRLDKLMADLARTQQLVTKLEGQMAEISQRHDREAHAAGQALVSRMNPDAHRRALDYLTQLRNQSRLLAEEHRAKSLERDRLRAACVAQQLRIEGLTQHKEEALIEYADEVRKRISTEQDRDWLARAVASRGVRKDSR
ncbi:hypothetical protein [Variovorax ginsengisoli]|uniref:Flagellar FliJ protein n=1 Tax=Variovorax ginsengisoli TaxID=363844 RepID=A0ABT8SI32_9BURK|nr:hypothetical protein [Variovorax ginsengisoli]MDN8618016.1 hypothetical protein [Variovorax ginsengisoli]MDO1537186.1 hypothetical protein [Variovorax ginsengisoli]